jgi:hypothetical protein
MPNPDFTIEELLAFARSKPADERYDFCDAGFCAIAQFGRATNRPHLINLGDIGIYSEPVRLAVMASGCSTDWTFGKLAVRLSVLLPAISDTWTRPDAYLTDMVEA